MGTLQSDPGDIRLDSWKKIAAYLDRDLRTVRRWEKERGLPIHRVPGGGRGAIYAFAHEIDTWLLHPDHLPRKNGNAPGAAAAGSIEPGHDAPGPDAQKVSFSAGNGIASEAAGSHYPPDLSASRSLPTTRFPKPVTATAFIVVGLLLCVPLFQWLRSTRASSVADAGDPILISSVSPLLPLGDQQIVIRGSGFGLHVPYRNTDSPFIAIRDKTAGWSAGRIIPQNWDEIMLDVQSWDDKQIVIRRFSGAYGSSGWKLNAGDDIEVAVWNPQSGRGPALYHLRITDKP